MCKQSLFIEMKKESKEKHFIHKPIYEGGIKAMREFIRSQLVYPQSALQNKTEGTVHLKYEVDYKGQVKKVKVVSGLGNGCDEEAIRIVKLFQFKISKNRNLRVKFQKKIQIHFKLPKQASKAENLQLNYQLRTKSKIKDSSSGSSSGYSYTINI